MPRFILLHFYCSMSLLYSTICAMLVFMLMFSLVLNVRLNYTNPPLHLFSQSDKQWIRCFLFFFHPPIQFHYKSVASYQAIKMVWTHVISRFANSGCLTAFTFCRPLPKCLACVCHSHTSGTWGTAEERRSKLKALAFDGECIPLCMVRAQPQCLFITLSMFFTFHSNVLRCIILH